jgi:ABC-2 type transport system ATP-binding protein
MTLGIEVKQLKLNYGRFTAIHDMSFKLAGGKIYGLLGRNGSGKTTLLSILASFRKQTTGEVAIGGEAPFENEAIMEQVCFIQESGHIMEGAKVVDVLRLAARSWPNWDEAYAQRLINVYELPLNKQVMELSRGMKSSLGVTLGLASRAPVTIFDEAYLGMDAPSRYSFYDELLKDYMDNPRTFIVSTHLIEEVDSLFEEVLIIDQGRLLLHEETDALRLRATAVTGPADAVDRFVEGLNVLEEKALGKAKTVIVYDELSSQRRKQSQLEGLELEPVALQDLFVQLTKKRRDK